MIGIFPLPEGVNTFRKYKKFLKTLKLNELYEICNLDNFTSCMPPFRYFDITSTKNIKKKEKVLRRLITGEITHRETRDKKVFELIPDGIEDMMFDPF